GRAEGPTERRRQAKQARPLPNGVASVAKRSWQRRLAEGRACLFVVAGNKKVNTWLQENQYQESECPPVSVSDSYINKTISNAINQHESKTNSAVPLNKERISAFPSASCSNQANFTSPVTRIKSASVSDLNSMNPSTVIASSNKGGIPVESLKSDSSKECSSIVIPVTNVGRITSTTRSKCTSASNLDSIIKVPTFLAFEKKDANESNKSTANLSGNGSSSAVSSPILVKILGSFLISLRSKSLSAVLSPSCKTPIKSSVPSSPLTSPANKIFGLSGFTGVKAVMKKDKSLTTVRRKLAYSTRQPLLARMNTSETSNQPTPSQKCGVKRKSLTPEKTSMVTTTADEQYVKKRNILHDTTSCAVKASAMDGKHFGFETNSIAKNKDIDSTSIQLREMSIKDGVTLTPADVPFTITVSENIEKISSPSPGVTNDGLIADAMDRLSVKQVSEPKVTPTPVPRLKSNIPVPAARTTIVKAILPVPAARTTIVKAIPVPAPRGKSRTPPKPTPRSSLLTPPSPISDGFNSEGDFTCSDYATSFNMEDNPTGILNLDEGTMLLPVLNMDDVDAEFHKIIQESSLLSPGQPIILPSTPTGNGTPISKDDDTTIFSLRTPAFAIPPTPPETPEVPNSSSEVEIVATSLINEEALAAPLAELDESFQENEGYVTPQKVTTRKKERTLSKQDKAKAACNQGKEYTNMKGVIVQARQMRPPCVNCRFKCHDKISEEERDKVFKKYWALGEKQKQDGFIRESITIKKPAVQKTGDDVTQRAHTIKYSFKFPSGQLFVCKTMFLNTLGISESPVRTQVEKLERGGIVTSPDKRGKHPKIDPVEKNKQDSNIKEHIGLFKTVPSHFCRMRSKRKYLSPTLTIRQMWRLYKTWMSKNKPSEAIKSEKRYRKVFCTQFNLGFHKPKKDRCDLCLVYEIGTAAQKLKLQAKFDEHLRNKKNAKAARKEDEKKAKACSDTVCYCLMDLQQVISLPKTEAGMVFYKRKLSTYNFTVYDKTFKKGYCYLWDESEAKRGANEIATCVLLFIKKKVSEGITDFFIWSDNCGGQNKNKYLFSAYTWAAAQYNITITHRYMERGHTMNEADSMHSTIEKAARYEQIYVPKDLVPIIENAKRKGSKYDVKLVGPEILDFHPLADTLQNWTNKNAKWKSLREIVVDGENPGKVFVKHDLTAPTAVEIKITKVGGQVNLTTYLVPKAFDGPLRLKAKKLTDLANLCNELVIPSHKHDFYKGLLNFPDLNNPLLSDNANEDELSEDEEARQTAEREFLFDYENDEEVEESDYEEELQIAKKDARKMEISLVQVKILM
ncbi:hypothetical protein KUF71_019640, partial [Frankliniella fusca]